MDKTNLKLQISEIGKFKERCDMKKILIKLI